MTKTETIHLGAESGLLGCEGNMLFPHKPGLVLRNFSAKLRDQERRL